MTLPYHLEYLLRHEDRIKAICSIRRRREVISQGNRKWLGDICRIDPVPESDADLCAQAEACLKDAHALRMITHRLRA